MTKQKKRMLFIGLILVATIITTLLYHMKSPGSEESGTSSMNLLHQVSLHVYETEGGWAYEILVDSSVFIFQEQIPGLPNMQKFASKGDATKCGDLVMQKLKHQQNPSVSIAELDSLGIDY